MVIDNVLELSNYFKTPMVALCRSYEQRKERLIMNVFISENAN